MTVHYLAAEHADALRLVAALMEDGLALSVPAKCEYVTFARVDGKFRYKACALGATYLGHQTRHGLQIRTTCYLDFPAYLQQTHPVLQMFIPGPLLPTMVDLPKQILYTIMELNDHRHWTREQIVAWLRTMADALETEAAAREVLPDLTWVERSLEAEAVCQ